MDLCNYMMMNEEDNMAKRNAPFQIYSELSQKGGLQMKKIVSLLLCCIILISHFPVNSLAESVNSSFLNNCSSSYKKGKYYTNLAALNLSGNLGANLVAVAKSQLGYHEGSGPSDLSGESSSDASYTEYNRWYFNNAYNHQHWCNLFVSWCCSASGINTSIAPKNPFYLKEWKNKGAKVYSWQDYTATLFTPKPGDIVIYGNSTTNNKAGSSLSDSYKHIGIITSHSGGTFQTVEGNWSNKVSARTYTPNKNTGCITSGNYIHAIIQPKYNQITPVDQYMRIESGRWYCRTGNQGATVFEWDGNKRSFKPNGTLDPNRGYIISEILHDKQDNDYVAWYKTEYGYVMPTHVLKFERADSKREVNREKKIVDNAFFRVTPRYAKVWLESEPYSTYKSETDHQGMFPVYEGEVLTVKAIWENKYDNYWLEFFNGYFLCANNVIEVPYEQEYEHVRMGDDYVGPKKFQNYPSNVKSISLAGTITSLSTINRVEAGWYNLDGTPAVPICSYSLGTTNTLKIQDKINNALKASELVKLNGGKGCYIYRICVYYSQYKNISNEKDQPLTEATWVFEQPFTIGGGLLGEDNPLGDIAFVTPISNVYVTSVELDRPTLSLNVGEVFTLKPTVKPDNATNRNLEWKSLDPNVATVENGKVKAIGPGTTEIGVVAVDREQVFDRCVVEVKRKVSKITITGNINVLYLNESVQLTPIVEPSDATEKTVAWSTSDPNKAIVSSTGLVTTKGTGDVVITAKATDGSNVTGEYKITCKSYVTQVTIKGKDEIPIGGSAVLKSDILPVDASDPTITWVSSNKSVATISADGIIEGKAEGETTITATAADRGTVKDTRTITVYQPIGEINLSGPAAMHTGDEAQCIVKILPENAATRPITWSSDNENAVTVDSSGKVRAVGNGKAIITVASTEDSSVRDEIEIEVTTLAVSVTLSGPETVDVGSTGVVHATILPETTSEKRLKWHCDNEELAVVDGEGNITGLAPGYVRITAETIDGSNITTEPFELEIFQKIQSISVDTETVAYEGDIIYPEWVILPEDASNKYLEWTSSDNNIITFIPDEMEYYHAKCIGTGTVTLTATATDGSGVSGYAHVEVRKYTELSNNEATYILYTDGTSNGTFGRISLTSDCMLRIAEEKQGAVWNIEHISGDYAASIGINEKTYSYSGFSLANSVDLNLLRINKAGTDQYRISCTINGYTDSCIVTVTVKAPEAPLPESVTIGTTTFYGTVGQAIIMDVSPITSPSGTLLPENGGTFLYGIGSFNRYSRVSMGTDEYTVTFSKAGTYSAYVRYFGSNYVYDCPVEFIITNESGTVPPAVERIELTSSSLYLLPGETGSFETNIYPSGADDAALTWASSDPEVAAVSSDGTVTAVQPGTAVVTVAADNGITANGFVTVTDSLLSIDWNRDNCIQVFVGGSSMTEIQRMFLTPRASAQLSEAPQWTIKRLDGDNLTLTCSPVTVSNNGQTLYGCAIILKSVSRIGTTEYELTCSDGIHTASTIIRVNADELLEALPSLVTWKNNVFTGQVNQLMLVYPEVQCWPANTHLPNEVTVSVTGDMYWKAALNARDFTVSRKMMSFSFKEPGVYTADYVYSCSNMKYIVPVTVRIQDENGNVPVRVQSIMLNYDELSVKAGDSVQLSAHISPDDATNKTITWRSENENIAAVDTNGTVTGVNNGRTYIWCTPDDTSCAAVKCAVIVEDSFTVNRYDGAVTQYLQGDTGLSVADFKLSNGTNNRLREEGLEPLWTLQRISGNSAEVELTDNDGVHSIIPTKFLKAGQDVYEVTCTAGNYTWSDQITFTIESTAAGIPSQVTIANASYSVQIGEEITLDFTPVCTPAGTIIPTDMVNRSMYIGIGDFYKALQDSYVDQLLFAEGDQVQVAFKMAGRFILSRHYHTSNLTYVTSCSITVGEGSLNLLTCDNPEATVYIGGTSSIAATATLYDIMAEELFGKEITWTAEKLSGDCLTVSLIANQSSASLYVVNAKEEGSETWRITCSFRGEESHVDVTIHALHAYAELPESVTLYQSDFTGMEGKTVHVPIAVNCLPEGSSLPETSDAAWTFHTDINGQENAVWSIKDSELLITFRNSGYYGGTLRYQSGNVSYDFPLSFAITDEESVQAKPRHLGISINYPQLTVYPEGETGIAIIEAQLYDPSSEYGLSGIRSYAENVGASWVIERIAGASCGLSVQQINPAYVQIMLDNIASSGDTEYRLSCTIDGNLYSATGRIHVATANESRPQAELRQSYYITPVGSKLTIDASLYDHVSGGMLCSGANSNWNNESALSAIGYSYQESGNNWLPVFYEPGTYQTTLTALIGNLRITKDLTIRAYLLRQLPASPMTLTFPKALRVVDDESFVNLPINIADFRNTRIVSIGDRAFAECRDLLRVYLPSTVTSISTSAFIGCDSLVIYCTEGTYADQWAQMNHYPTVYNEN